MIKISEGVKVGYAEHVLTSQTQNHNIMFFEGVMPTRAEYLAAVNPFRAGGLLSVKNVVDAMKNHDVSNDLLGYTFTSTTVKPKRLSPDRTSFPFSDSQAALTWKKDGTISFFVLFIGNNVGTDLITANGVKSVVVGTVGDVGSGADIEILGGNITQGQEYRINDVVLQLNT